MADAAFISATAVSVQDTATPASQEQQGGCQLCTTNSARQGHVQENGHLEQLQFRAFTALHYQILKLLLQKSEEYLRGAQANL